MAVIPQLAHSALVDARVRTDPMLDFKWYSEVIPEGLPSNYLESIDVPFNNITVGEGLYGGSGFTYYPGTHDIAGFSATFYEDSLGTTIKWLLGWKSKVKNFSTGVYYLPVNYKRDWKVTLLNTKNEPIMTVKLIGVWPSETSNLPLNYTSNGRIVISQQFSIDDATYE